MPAPVASAALDLLSFLRDETRNDHRALERSLDLLRFLLEPARFLRIMSRFYGFHAVWEDRIGQHPTVAAIGRSRLRLGLLRQDLQALGLIEREIAVLPHCVKAADLVGTMAEAIGSLYVIEGSTLGGQIISRALTSQTWLPPGGLSYFDPYGGRAGIMWRLFRDWCDAQASGLEWNQVTQGARATFTVLQDWLAQ